MFKMNNLELQIMLKITNALNNIQQNFKNEIKCNSFYNGKNVLNGLEYTTKNSYLFKIMQQSVFTIITDMCEQYALFLKTEFLSDNDFLSFSVKIPYGDFEIELFCDK